MAKCGAATAEPARLEAINRGLRLRFQFVGDLLGVVGIRGVDVGARVDDETVLTTLDDLAEVEIGVSNRRVVVLARFPTEEIQPQKDLVEEAQFPVRATRIVKHSRVNSSTMTSIR